MSSFAFILLCIYLFSVVKIGNSNGPKTIEWKQDLICPKKQAVKHIKYNVTSTGEKNWYFACGNHAAGRLDDDCDEKDSADKKQHSTDGRKTRKTVHYDDPISDETCDKIYRNATQTQTFGNGTTSKSECVWRQKCVVNKQHQEIVRGARLSETKSAVEYFCCISHCLQECRHIDMSQFKNASWKLKPDEIIVSANQTNATVEVCRDCDAFIARGLIISGPCSYAISPNSELVYQYDAVKMEEIYPPKRPLRNNQFVGFECKEGFYPLPGARYSGVRNIYCYDWILTDNSAGRLICVPE